MTIRPDVAATVSLPGYVHDIELHGHPQAGQVQVRNGRPVIPILLGDPVEGCAYGADSVPHLDAASLAELDELIAAVLSARARYALWLADHEGALA